MSSTISTYISTDFDLTLGILNVRIDSVTNSIQISTTGDTVDILYDIKMCDTINHTVTYSCSSTTGISTTPVNLDSSVVNSLTKYAEVQIINLTSVTTYSIRVACVDDSTPSTPLYLIAIFKPN
jgi:hypothetical protein